MHRPLFEDPAMRSLLSLPLLLLLAAPSAAQLPQARLDRLFPLGGRAGESVVVEVQGKDLDELTTLHVDRPGFKVERLKNNQFRLTIPADASPGTVEVRAVGRFGLSGGRLFAVQKGLAEVLEKEPNNTAEQAQKVPLDCAINGTSDGDGDDYFRFTAKKGQRVVIDCLALRLDSTLRAALVLSDSKGKVLARGRPYHQRTDPLVDFVAPADGDYLVQLHDTTYAGGLPYRLVISTRPHIENAFPAAVEPGKSATLTVLGRNLPGGKPYPGGKVLDRELDMLRIDVTMPKQPLDRLRFAFHPSSPAAAMRGVQLWPKGLEDALNPVTLVAARAPVTLEKEPNDTADRAQLITLPTTLCGRFDRPGDADWYRFSAKAGEQVHVDLLCERLDLPGDPYVLIQDDKGNELTQLDDHGINFNALAQYNRDPVGTFTAPATGTYRLLVQDRYRQGGPRHGYVVHLGKLQPDFFPVAVHPSNPDPTCPLVRAGGSAHLDVCLNRRNLPGGVVIEAKGLPTGVSCPPVHVSPQTEVGTVVFTAAPDAKSWEGSIRLEATATALGRKITRPVVAVQRRWHIANVSTSRLCREVCLAVRPGAPYGLRLPATATVAAGGSVEVKVRLRRAGDFKGKVQLGGLELPPGFGLAAALVPAGKDEATAKLTVAGNVPPGSYTVVLRGDAQVPYSRDPKAASKPNVRVADPSTPLTLTVTAAAKK
jgi:hypothetical protein